MAGCKAQAVDPLASADGVSARAPRGGAVQLVAAAAVYGRAAAPGDIVESGAGGKSGAGGGGALPPALSLSLAPLVEAGELTLSAKGGATTSHPIA